MGEIDDAIRRAAANTATRPIPKTAGAQMRFLLKAEKSSTRAVAGRLGGHPAHRGALCEGTLRRPRRDLAARLERLFDAQAAVATEQQIQRIAAARLLRGPGTGVAEEAAVTEHSSWPVSTRVGDLSPAFRVIQRPGVADLGCDLRGHGGGCLRGVSPGVGVRAVFVLGSGLWVGGRRSASVRGW